MISKDDASVQERDTHLKLIYLSLYTHTHTHKTNTHSLYFLLPEENLWLNRINREKPNQKVKRTIVFLLYPNQTDRHVKDNHGD